MGVNRQAKGSFGTSRSTRTQRRCGQRRDALAALLVAIQRETSPCGALLREAEPSRHRVWQVLHKWRREEEELVVGRHATLSSRSKAPIPESTCRAAVVRERRHPETPGRFDARCDHALSIGRQPGYEIVARVIREGTLFARVDRHLLDPEWLRRRQQRIRWPGGFHVPVPRFYFDPSTRDRTTCSSWMNRAIRFVVGAAAIGRAALVDSRFSTGGGRGRDFRNTLEYQRHGGKITQ